jgi:hypothetical protein
MNSKRTHTAFGVLGFGDYIANSPDYSNKKIPQRRSAMGFLKINSVGVWKGAFYYKAMLIILLLIREQGTLRVASNTLMKRQCELYHMKVSCAFGSLGIHLFRLHTHIPSNPFCDLVVNLAA